MSRWFRFYAEAMRNPKVMRLADNDFRLWVRLLAVASENDGRLPPIADLKLLLNARLDRLADGLQRLINSGLIDVAGQGYEPHNWSKFQYKSDTSTPRVTLHRAKRNVTVTPPDTEADTETEEIANAISIVQDKPAKKRGCRLPIAWQPTFDDHKDYQPDIVVRELARFRDYWATVPGAKGVKLDWDATWRNWMRKATETRNGNGHMERHNGTGGGQYRRSPGLEWAKQQFAIGDDGGTVEADAWS
jgi:hypothetical protein